VAIVDNKAGQSGHSKYVQIKVSVDPDLASAFKAACVALNVSMVGAISKYMSEFSKAAFQRKPLPDYSTKRQRRAAVKKVIRQLEQIKAAEEAYMCNIPENLQGSVVYENAEQFVSSVEEAIEILDSL